MRIFIFLGLLFGFYSTSGAIYKTRKLFTFQGQEYAAIVKINEKNIGQIGQQIISVNFFLLKHTSDYTKYLESIGGYFNMKRVFIRDTDKEFKLVKDLSTPGKKGLGSFSKCIPTFSKDRINLLLTGSIEVDNLNIDLVNITSDLTQMDSCDFLSDVYKDEIYSNRLKSIKTLNNNYELKDRLYINFIPKFEGNIDSKEFPLNRNLLYFLKNNTNFVFKVSREFYLDLLRFKINPSDYDKEKVYTFLQTYDLLFFKYQGNEEVLNTKIKDCIKALIKTSRLINLGNIYYKEFPVNPDDINFSSPKFEFKTPFLQEEERNKGKKIIGEPDAFYSANGLNIYLPNMKSLRSLNLADSQVTSHIPLIGNPKPFTFRVYFHLQPYPVYSKEGEFEGINAYALKSILYNTCSTVPLASADNGYIKNISDSVTKRCYTASVNYLNKYYSGQNYNLNVHAEELYYDNFIALGNWYQSISNCEVGYVSLAGKMKKVSENVKLLTLRMMTNHKTIFQIGNRVTFKNSNTGVSFHLPVTDAWLKLTGTKGGYYNLRIKIPTETYKKFLTEHVDNISFQCAGEPEFEISHKYFYYNPNEQLTTQIDEIQTPFSVNAQSGDSMLEVFLKMGL